MAKFIFSRVALIAAHDLMAYNRAMFELFSKGEPPTDEEIQAGRALLEALCRQCPPEIVGTKEGSDWCEAACQEADPVGFQTLQAHNQAVKERAEEQVQRAEKALFSALARVVGITDDDDSAMVFRYFFQEGTIGFAPAPTVTVEVPGYQNAYIYGLEAVKNSYRDFIKDGGNRALNQG